MKKSDTKEKDNNKKINIKYYLNIISILSILAGPIELLVIYIIFGKINNFESVNIVIFIGFLFLATLIYRLILFFINWFLLKTKGRDYDTPEWLIMTSYLVSYFVIIKIMGEGIITDLILCVFIFVIKSFILCTEGGGNCPKTVEKTSKKPRFDFKTTYYTDEFGNYKGSSTTIDYGDGIKTTRFQDSVGNYTGKVDSFSFHDDKK